MNNKLTPNNHKNIYNMILSTTPSDYNYHNGKFEDLTILSERGNIFTAKFQDWEVDFQDWEVDTEKKMYCCNIINKIILNLSNIHGELVHLQKYKDRIFKSFEEITEEGHRLPYHISIEGHPQFISTVLLQWIQKESNLYPSNEILFSIDGCATNWNLFKQLFEDGIINRLPSYIIKTPIDISTLFYVSGYHPEKTYRNKFIGDNNSNYVKNIIYPGDEANTSIIPDSVTDIDILYGCFAKFQFKEITNNATAIIIN